MKHRLLTENRVNRTLIALSAALLLVACNKAPTPV
jgi:hypothetical protein